MKSRVKREMDKQLIYIASLLIIVGKTRPDYQTMVKSRSNCFIISGCCVITGTGSNMVRHFGHYEMLCNTPYLRPNRMLCNRFHGGRHLGTTGTTIAKTNALYYSALPYYRGCGIYKLVFYSTIVNKILRHCHSCLARQYLQSDSWALFVYLFLLVSHASL